MIYHQAIPKAATTRGQLDASRIDFVPNDVIKLLTKTCNWHTQHTDMQAVPHFVKLDPTQSKPSSKCNGAVLTSLEAPIQESMKSTMSPKRSLGLAAASFKSKHSRASSNRKGMKKDLHSRVRQRLTLTWLPR